MEVDPGHESDGELPDEGPIEDPLVPPEDEDDEAEDDDVREVIDDREDDDVHEVVEEPIEVAPWDLVDPDFLSNKHLADRGFINKGEKAGEAEHLAYSTCWLSAAVGVFFGLGWIGLGWYMNHADVVEHFKDVEDALQETNEVHDAAIIDVDDFQRVSKYLEALGTVIVIFSCLGHVMIFIKNKVGMALFSAYLCCSLLFVTVVGIVLLQNGEKIMTKVKQDSIRFWKMSVHPLSPIDKYLRRYEASRGCCGWNNAIDYCDQKAVEDLMESVIDEGVTENIIKYDPSLRDAKEDGSFSDDYAGYSDYSYDEYATSYSSNETDSLKGSTPDDSSLYSFADSDSEIVDCNENDSYNGDESCICATIEQFADSSVSTGLENLKQTVCVHDTPLCYHDSYDDACFSHNSSEPWRSTGDIRRDVYLILLVASILTFAVNAKDINAKIKQDSVRFWRMATHPASPFDKFLRRYEMDNNCCGWNNAIDYCDQTALYSLMETVIDQKATLKAINYNADAETDYSSSFYPEYSSNVYSVDYSSSSNDALKSASDYGYCSDEEEYDGDEACICNTVESFGSAGNGFLDLKYLTCIHNSEVCHFSESITCASDNPEEEEYQPWRTTAFPQNISISEVCGAETCFINGCGDIFSDDFWKYGFTRPGSIEVIYK
ncbi:Oidioi.mRNA.OKI2018_I69.PAR.g10752.t1.cds [Oikopleura dioica]|uniref:Oidioi.mRNA.OKI2018_I69.PAR.g10752.t1.cds n=1 Tax=Oikopleura dioica TaxID=34765 RepID=A0ABN7RVM0_OIKDI|nr:Oidioi.mRNA.OKI2018_I69.PAR.g10752.t1.cds [Oikopleura dioica]